MAQLKEERTTGSFGSHEPGSIRDGTSALEAGANSFTRDDAIKLGQDTARENVKHDKANGFTTDAADDRQDLVEDAQETARLNHKADQENQIEQGDNRIENDTSKTAKQATAKAQLDPTGNDPISTAEVNRSATNASMETGNKTAVSNEEQAQRATESGRAEEENSFSTANGGVTEDLTSKEVQNTGDKSTSNKTVGNKK